MVVDIEPGLCDLAIGHAKDDRFVVHECSPWAFAALGRQGDSYFVVRQDVIELDTKRPAGLLERVKETENIIAPAVLARETALAEGVPDDVVGK